MTNPALKDDVLLEIRNLRVSFTTQEGSVAAVNDVSFDVKRGEILAIVGESGSGKSVTAMAILGLVATPPGRIDAGEILFEGDDLLKLDEERLRSVRGNRIAMIFQDPMSSLNPVHTVGFQVAEPLRIHRGMNERGALARCVELLRSLRISEPRERLDQYPHQFSGGMRQRVMMAMGMGCAPEIIVADEPTTALDVTVQAQLLDLLEEQVSTHKGALILITHNLGVVARYAHRVVVMYAGNLVEKAESAEIYANPRHPYTLGLLASVPRLDQPSEARLRPVEGQPPDPLALPKGCPFHPRCPYAVEKCRMEAPPLRSVAASHEIACWVDVDAV